MKKAHRIALAMCLVGCATAGTVACSIDNIEAVDKDALQYVNEQNDRDAFAVLADMNEIVQSREAVIEESARESKSEAASIEEAIESSIAVSKAEAIAASIKASIAEAESESIEESIAASIEESVAASIEESVAASIAESKAIEDEKRKQEALGADIVEIRKKFADVVVIGDSRAKGIVDCNLLTENEVNYYGGASVPGLFDIATLAASKMRSKALFIVGLNDLGWYKQDANRFKADLIRLIDTYRAINPNCKIYLQDILPVLEWGRPFWPNMDARPAFVEAIKEICNEYGYTFVSANYVAYPEYVNSEDGAHYGLIFYKLWAQAMIEQMGL